MEEEKFDPAVDFAEEKNLIHNHRDSGLSKRFDFTKVTDEKLSTEQ